ncbi:MAG: NeuD/PglB/VioB family sugar acetyltransferase [Anaerolineae bacterium]|nr:NeuD/PglB/VioB family sugar acetyltransferase [Anaerolineae bacterium]
MSTVKRCVILGGGGHARVLIDTLHVSGAAIPFAILDADATRWGTEMFCVPIVGGDDRLPDVIRQGADCFTVGLGSVGNTRPRQKLFELGLSYNLEPLTIIHPTAVLSPRAQIGAGSHVLPCAIVNAGAIIGQNVIVNSGAIVEHDCVLADHIHIATGATLASTVHIGTGAHIGAGAVVRQCITIGEGAVVGAGAVVVKDVPPYITVVGVPAHPLNTQSGR